MRPPKDNYTWAVCKHCGHKIRKDRDDMDWGHDVGGKWLYSCSLKPWGDRDKTDSDTIAEPLTEKEEFNNLLDKYYENNDI